MRTCNQYYQTKEPKTLSLALLLASISLFSPGWHEPIRVQSQAGALKDALPERVHIHSKETSARSGGGLADQEISSIRREEDGTHCCTFVDLLQHVTITINHVYICIL